ncbi:uncharacterized protein TRAVEDRAFT_46340 [Trametes versicolor FP-101664 SS1]|uniref:uncharacterized protein n=1 Tax=Trametes versicolor (strain FP-101664) TaxID=717944 RepID=UPI0004621D0D|nr:uncharacterized protein TRAVEDRAFT_46340 [Trametes versicolor FP-101664 SS1]EIW61116.1 hypothetical protein TRAVEDRAFT_46340 [Trametes versicolor FP-101664 SS1]
MHSRCRAYPAFCKLTRSLHASSSRRRELFDPANVDRPSDKFDVCILELEKGRELRVVVLENGTEVGSHILSGAVIEPRALNELLPGWKDRPDRTLTQPTSSTQMRLSTANRSFCIPHPLQMAKTGTYVVSPFASRRHRRTNGRRGLPGLLTRRSRAQPRRHVYLQGAHERSRTRIHDAFESGMQFQSRVTLFAEGAHGSLSKEAIRRFKRREGRDTQTYGPGIKEVWRVDPSNHEPRPVVHSMGWPLDLHAYGGEQAYHMADGLQVTLGLVVAFDHPNPHLSPYRELQRTKHHPYFRDLLPGSSTRIAYGARVLNEGHLRSVPRLNSHGDALFGCSAGFSWVHGDLHEVRNVRPSSNIPLGILGGVVYSDIDTLLLRGRTLSTSRDKLRLSDAAHTKRASECKPTEYPSFQPPLSTDFLTSVALTGTNHAESQPVHLRAHTSPRAARGVSRTCSSS